MTIEKLKDLPGLIKSGKMTVKQAIEKSERFINPNHPNVGLNKYDEDNRFHITII